MNGLYFDHNATTPVTPAVKQELLRAISLFGNPSAYYQLGEHTKIEIETARAACALLLGVSPAQVIFTSGGTESNNLAIGALLSPLNEAALTGSHVISSSIEHPSVLETLRRYQHRGMQLTLIDPDNNGRVQVQTIKSALRPNTRLIALMAINNESGVIQPIKQVAQLAADAGIHLHVDGVQAVGKYPLDLERLPGLTTLSFSGHKFNGPKGVGGLYFSPGVRLDPLFFGGGQEFGIRSGTENVLGIIGLAVAAKEALSSMDKRLIHYASLRAWLLTCLNQWAVRYVHNGSENPQWQAAWTLNLSFENVRAESLASRLDLCHGISLSLGSACSSNKEAQRSHVLRSMGFSDERIDGAIRISFGHETTTQDIETLAEAIHQEIAHLMILAGQKHEGIKNER